VCQAGNVFTDRGCQAYLVSSAEQDVRAPECGPDGVSATAGGGLAGWRTVRRGPAEGDGVRVGVERRAVLRAGLVVLAGVGPLAAGCTEQAVDPGPDPLAVLAETALADAAEAESIAAALPTLAPAAGVIAAARREHAAALRAEVDRVRPTGTSTSDATSTTSVAAPAPTDVAVGSTQLQIALQEAEKAAVELVATLPRHRAGLVGSLAAGCASLREVLA